MTQKRQLAAILFADIAGYTALMQKDESNASILLNLFQKNLEFNIDEYNGRIVNFYGDGALCVFENPLEAIRCAMYLQKNWQNEPVVPVRIGVHMGTVVFDEGKVYGNSVNLASRIESMGIPGAVLFSDTIKNEIKNQADIHFTSLGKFSFKNVDDEMEVFAIANDGYVVPKKEDITGKFSDKKANNKWVVSAVSALILMVVIGMVWNGFFRHEAGQDSISTLAIMPFTNFGSDESNEFYSAGVHEDIINKLAGLKNLKVISRTSVMNYQNSAEDLKAIGKRLGARYIVEGSLMRMNDQVKVRARLFDASKDQSLWSEEYDGKLEDVFGMQSTIAQRIANSLKTRITDKEQNQLSAILTRTPEAYDNFIKARTILNGSQLSYENLKLSIRMLEKAVTADDQFTDGWALLSIARSELYDRESQFDNKEKEAKLASEDALKALDKAKNLNPESAITYRAEGFYKVKVKDDEIEGLRSYDKALELSPNDYEILMDQGMMYIYMGKPDLALSNFERAHVLNQENGFLHYLLKTGYELSKQYEKIPPLLEKLLELEPDKTHYKVEAKYFQFLSDGRLESWHEFEDAIKTIEITDNCDMRTVKDNQAVVAMINGDFDSYINFWEGAWDSHHASHGNWSCPAILNDETNKARLLIEFGDTAFASQIIETAIKSSTRPINENSVCIFDKNVLIPKFDFLSGDSVSARKKFDQIVSQVLQNNKFPRGAVERRVLLQTADLVAPERVYDIYKEVVNSPVSIIGLEAICADPFTYPNLLKHPAFLEEVKKDGRFIEFLEHYQLHKRGIIPAGHHHEG